MRKSFDFSTFRVVVSDVAEGVPPWGTQGVTKYSVTVKRGGVVYRCNAWGSIHNHDNGKLDHEAIGAMVIDELASAFSDPEEFASLCVGEDTPFAKAHKAYHQAERIIRKAQEFGEDIIDAANVLREAGKL